jgi:hypothetical protein
MRAGPIVIFHVTEQQVTEVAFAEYNDVVNAFPSDRTDQPFGRCVLPRGTRRCWPVADAYRSESADKNLTISTVPVTNEIAGSLFPPACFRDLVCDPFCGWMRCDAKPLNMSAAVPHDQQSIERAKRDCRHDEHIHRSDPRNVLQPWDGGSRRLTMYLATLVCPISTPSLRSSPWIRGAPHSGLAMLISRISLRISNGTVGLRPRAFDFQRQYNRSQRDAI